MHLLLKQPFLQVSEFTHLPNAEQVWIVFPLHLLSPIPHSLLKLKHLLLKQPFGHNPELDHPLPVVLHLLYANGPLQYVFPGIHKLAAGLLSGALGATESFVAS